jgi:PPOX class probable F420-dependent enzyme
MFDETSEFGARVLRRLEEETLIWLTTVGADGTPQPNPVWFHWDGGALLIFSQPNTPKLRNIAARPRVALNFNTDEHGENVVVLAGDARIDPEPVSETQMAAYLEKYSAGIAKIGLTPESMLASYSVAIRVVPTRVRGF